MVSCGCPPDGCHKYLSAEVIKEIFLTTRAKGQIMNSFYLYTSFVGQNLKGDCDTFGYHCNTKAPQKEPPNFSFCKLYGK